MKVQYRPLSLLCEACAEVRRKWAHLVLVPERPPCPEPCPECVERCDAARFTLAARGRDPIRTIVHPDGTEDEYHVFRLAEANDEP